MMQLTKMFFYDAEGDAYGKFIVETLKPFIDSNYRTKTSKEHTFISGSSMGGVISFYLGLKYPNVFLKSVLFPLPLNYSPNSKGNNSIIVLTLIT